jgi:hypothetical protein
MAQRTTSRTIVLTPNPMGRFLNGVIEGTPSPGTIMQIKAATELVGGLFTWVVYNRGADAERPIGPYAILLEDHLQGRGVDTAYATGEHGRLYIPLPGDELLGLFANASGTDTFAIGDLAIVDDGTGLLIATTGSPESEPFMVCETVDAEVWSASTLLHMMFTGY